MTKISSYNGYWFPPEIIPQAIWRCSVYPEFSRRRRFIGGTRNHGLLRDRPALTEPIWTQDRGAPAQRPTQAPCDLAFRRSLSGNRWPHGHLWRAVDAGGGVRGSSTCWSRAG